LKTAEKLYKIWKENKNKNKDKNKNKNKNKNKDENLKNKDGRLIS
jgi:hypothetical protein